MRQETAVPGAPPAPPARKVASWILTPPGDLTDGNRAVLAKITARCPELKAARELVRGFADMLCHRRGARHLEARASQAEASEVSEPQIRQGTPQGLGRRCRRGHLSLQLRHR
jgi:hypothetical protein